MSPRSDALGNGHHHDRATPSSPTVSPGTTLLVETNISASPATEEAGGIRLAGGVAKGESTTVTNLHCARAGSDPATTVRNSDEQIADLEQLLEIDEKAGRP